MTLISGNWDVYRFFTPQRAPDMWFSDELPPTYQDYLNSPEVRQARNYTTFQILQTLGQIEQRKMLQADPKMRKQYARHLAQQMKERAQQAV